jgi:hypothetical protein
MVDLRGLTESLGRRTGGALRIAGAIGLFVFAAWAELALLFKAPLGAAARPWLAGLAAAVFLAAAIALIARRFERYLVSAAGVMVMVILGWWWTLSPSALGQWPAELMRGTAIAIKGEDVEVRNVRTFRWNGPYSADERWEDRIYSFSDLKSVDLFVAEPKNGPFAQSIVSFVFGAGPPLAISLELRGDKGERTSALAALFRKYTIAAIAADESDTLKVRAGLRGETIYRYPLPLKTEAAAKLLAVLAARTQELNNRPEFYEPFSNGGAVLTTMLRKVGLIPAGFDYRQFDPGRDAEILFGLGLIEKARSFEDARKKADITAIIKSTPADAAFSAAIRR